MSSYKIKKILQYCIIGVLILILISILLAIVFLSKYTGDLIPTACVYIGILGVAIIGFGLFKLLGYLERDIVVDIDIDELKDLQVEE